jgi:primosomal replication protein N
MEQTNKEQKNINNVYLQGIIEDEPKFSYSTYGENFYEFFLRIKRISENEDIIPITISEKMLINKPLAKSESIAICGELRSYNKIIDEKRKLLLTILVKEILEFDNNKNSNVVELRGYICKEPIYRTTPFKKEICDILFAVNRAYNKSDYLPCIAWGKNARFLKNEKVGNEIHFLGRIQSRKYQKKIDETNVENHIAYEISICNIIFDEKVEE